MINIINDNFKEMAKKQIDQALKDKGFDELNRFILLLIIIGLFVDIFFKILIVGILDILLIIFFVYRLLSKNAYRKVKQNRIFMDICSYIKRPFKSVMKKLNRHRYLDKNHLYKKCPKCGLTIKMPLPKKIGIKHTTCPDCKTRFGFFTLKKRRD